MSHQLHCSLCSDTLWCIVIARVWEPLLWCVGGAGRHTHIFTHIYTHLYQVYTECVLVLSDGPPHHPVCPWWPSILLCIHSIYYLLHSIYSILYSIYYLLHSIYYLLYTPHLWLLWSARPTPAPPGPGQHWSYLPHQIITQMNVIPLHRRRFFMWNQCCA